MYTAHEKEFIRLNWQTMSRPEIAIHLKRDQQNLSAWMSSRKYISKEMELRGRALGQLNREKKVKNFPELSQKELYKCIEKFMQELKPGSVLHDIGIRTLGVIEAEEKRFSYLFNKIA